MPLLGVEVLETQERQSSREIRDLATVVYVSETSLVIQLDHRGAQRGRQISSHQQASHFHSELIAQLSYCLSALVLFTNHAEIFLCR